MPVQVRLPSGLVERMDKMVRRVCSPSQPVPTRSTVHRLALTLGLAALERKYK